MSEHPTLQEGDQSPDGWVEYLQELLGMPTPKWTGHFDAELTRWVKGYQETTHLHVDGIVGDQTWAALRGEALPASPGTDGREPHPYTQQGLALRLTNEITYVDGDDVLFLRAMAVGTDDPVEGTIEAVAEVKAPDGTSHQVHGTNEAYGDGTRLHTFYLRDVVGSGPGGVYEAMIWLPFESGQDSEVFQFNHVPR